MSLHPQQLALVVLVAGAPGLAVAADDRQAQVWRGAWGNRYVRPTATAPHSDSTMHWSSRSGFHRRYGWAPIRSCRGEFFLKR
jgi:hypothetical protein